eukprot:g1147.t1
MEQVGYESAAANLDAVFSALSDPTRRAILTRLAGGEASVNELAAPFEMSQPAVSKHLKLDVTPGGLWLNEMRMGGGSHYQRVEYTEVVAPEKLVWLHSVSDGDWNIASNPMMPDWPRVLLTTVTFEETDGKTDVRLTWVPHEASDAEIACFAGAISGLDKGWGKGMELLAEILEELQA